MQVKSLQRALLLTTAAVGTGVAITSVVLWRRLNTSVRGAVVDAATANESTPASAVVVTRVLVRRRADAPDEAGVVLRIEHVVGRSAQTSNPTTNDTTANAVAEAEPSSQGLVSSIKACTAHTRAMYCHAYLHRIRAAPPDCCQSGHLRLAGGGIRRVQCVGCA